MVIGMSELQASLLFTGFGVIVAVYALGWWQQRKYRRKFDAAFKANHVDVLHQHEPYIGAITELDTDKAVPIMEEQPVQIPAETGDEKVRLHDRVQCVQATADAHPADDAPDRSDSPAYRQVADCQASEIRNVSANRDDRHDNDEPLFPAIDLDAGASAAGTVEGQCAMLDADSDFIIELHLSEPCNSAVLESLWQRKFDFGKPVHVCGIRLNSLQWEKAMADSQTLYSRFRIALQLVDRGGAIGATKLADFRDLMLWVARNINADATVPDVNETHHRAARLDSFCAEVDQLIGFNLIPPGDRLLAGTKILQAASRHGMALEADGAFHLADAHGHRVVSLVNLDSRPFQHRNLETFSTPGITLLLDVPRAEHPAELFDLMVNIAHELARELQVNIVDDRRVLLSSSGLARIRAQIVEVEKKMKEYGVAPGGVKARRLFS